MTPPAAAPRQSGPAVLRLPSPSRLPFGLYVVAIYALARVVSFVILSLVAERQVPTGMSGGDHTPVNYLGFLAMWDGQWNEHIAMTGYPHTLPLGPDGRIAQNEWAFHPLFPVVARGIMIVTGWSFNAAAGNVSLVSGFVAAVLVATLLRDRIGRRGALAVTALWAVFPTAVILQVAYAEAMTIALLAACLLALSKEHWLAAAAFAVLTGLARPVALPLALVALIAAWGRWRRRSVDPLTRGEVIRLLTGLAGCGMAGFIWPGIAWWVTGVSTAYTDTQLAWRGSEPVQPIVPWIDIAHYLFGPVKGPVILAVVVVTVLLMTLGPWARGLGVSLRMWTVAYFGYLLAVVVPFTSIFRHILPLFPLLAVVLGVGRPGRPRSLSMVMLRLVPLLALSIAGQWYWTDILYQFTPPSDYPP